MLKFCILTLIVSSTIGQRIYNYNVPPDAHITNFLAEQRVLAREASKLQNSIRYNHGLRNSGTLAPPTNLAYRLQHSNSFIAPQPELTIGLSENYFIPNSNIVGHANPILFGLRDYNHYSRQPAVLTNPSPVNFINVNTEYLPPQSNLARGAAYSEQENYSRQPAISSSVNFGNDNTEFSHQQNNLGSTHNSDYSHQQNVQNYASSNEGGFKDSQSDSHSQDRGFDNGHHTFFGSTSDYAHQQNVQNYASSNGGGFSDAQSASHTQGEGFDDGHHTSFGSTSDYAHQQNVQNYASSNEGDFSDAQSASHTQGEGFDNGHHRPFESSSAYAHQQNVQNYGSSNEGGFSDAQSASHTQGERFDNGHHTSFGSTSDYAQQQNVQNDPTSNNGDFIDSQSASHSQRAFDNANYTPHQHDNIPPSPAPVAEVTSHSDNYYSTPAPPINQFQGVRQPPLEDSSTQPEQPLLQPSQPQVTKHFYFHTAPEDNEEEEQHLTLSRGPARKNYRVIFIKTPSISSRATALKIARAQSEEKTVIYVLSKKTDPAEIRAHIHHAANKVTKPEVFFIKYKTNEEAIHAQKQIQAEYDALGGTSQVSDEGISPVHSFVGTVPSGGRISAYNHNSPYSNRASLSSYLPPSQH